MTTGKQLRLERVAADVQLQDLADRMRKSRATLWHWEKSDTVDDDRAAEYRRALATFENVATGPAGA